MRLSGSCVIIAWLFSSFGLGGRSSCGLANVATTTEKPLALLRGSLSLRNVEVVWSCDAEREERETRRECPDG